MDDWLLPGIVQQSEGSSSGGSSGSDEDCDGPTAGRPANCAEVYPGPGAGGAHSRSPAEGGSGPGPGADTYHQRDPWVMQLDAGPGPSAADGAAGLAQARYLGSATAGGGALPVRLVSGASGRSLFGPFGSSSLQHRDSVRSMQPHPLTLIVHHHHQILPPPPRPPPTPAQPLAAASPRQPPPQQPQDLEPLPHQQRDRGQYRSLDRGRDRSRGQQQEQEEYIGAGALGLDDGGDDAEEDGRQGRIAGGGGASWSYLDPDPFALGTSASCSSLQSASRDPSPRPHPPASQSFDLQGRSGGGGGIGAQPLYGNHYNNSQYEHDFGTRLGSRLPRRGGSSGSSSSAADAGGLGIGRLDTEERPRRLSRGVGSLGLGLDEGPAADNLHGSGGSGSSGSRYSSWAGRGHMAGRYDGAGTSVSQSAAAAMVLWPLGSPGDMLRLPGGGAGRPGAGGGAGPATVGALERTIWPLDPEQLRHRHAARMRASELSAGWRPSQDAEDTDELRGSMAGTSSLALRSSEDPSSWEHQYGGGLGGRTSFGLRLGGSSNPAANRYNSRGTLGESDLSGLGPSSSRHAASAAAGAAAGGSRGTTPGGLGGGGYRTVGYGGTGGGGGLGGNGGGGGGATLCFTSLDSPSGPYDRRRIVLTSAHRRAQPEATTPSVRQYSDGLAGMLTNAQIQEWMSQHASRLLLPRHMQEIADIVFRPPSAAPEKKPLKCQPGAAAAVTLPPPVVLSGRYPPLHISRLVGDAAFMADLLSGLAGVDPGNSRVTAVVTALAGKDVVVRAEGDEGEAEPAGLSVLTKAGLRPASRIAPK